MRAQKKIFRLMLILTVIFIIGLVAIFLFSPEDNVFFDILKVVIPSLSMGLLVSAIMSFVFHRNEKDQYMKKLYKKARTIFYFFQQLTVEIDDMLDHSDRNMSLLHASSCKDNVNRAFETHNENPLFSEEYVPLFSFGKSLTKTQKKVDDVITILSIVVDFSTEINRIFAISYAPTYTETDAKFEFIYPFFVEFKGNVSKAAKNLDYCMTELEKRYSFDYSWIRTTKLVDSMIKSNEEQRKMQHRNAILTQISQNKRNKEVVSDISEFIPSIIKNPDLGNVIKSLEPLLHFIIRYFPKEAVTDSVVQKNGESKKIEIIEPSETTESTESAKLNSVESEKVDSDSTESREGTP